MRYLRLTVEADKNRNPSMQFRKIYFPECVPALGVYPVQDFLTYVDEHRPGSSNNFALANPRGKVSWREYARTSSGS